MLMKGQVIMYTALQTAKLIKEKRVHQSRGDKDLTPQEQTKK